jgi:hypothetical protein
MDSMNHHFVIQEGSICTKKLPNGRDMIWALFACEILGGRTQELIGFRFLFAEGTVGDDQLPMTPFQGSCFLTNVLFIKAIRKAI